MSDVPGTVLCCPDKFRGSISAEMAASALAEGVEQSGLEAVAHPLADGGEGTLEVTVLAGGGRFESLQVTDALGRTKTAQVGILRDGTVLVEMAQAAGLAALAPEERDVMGTSTFGVGLMIRRALEINLDRVVVTLGGSATMDGGLGALRALGAKLLDADGRELQGCGADLLRLEKIDTSRLIQPRPGAIEFAVDAFCPVHGKNATATVFGPQKGADAEQVALLDHGFRRLADRVGFDSDQRERFGTAGAFAATFSALFGAQVRSGAEFVREATDFDQALAGARLCVTGEGQVDEQSAMGKTAAGVIDAARDRSIPTIVVGGTLDESGSCLYDRGAAAILPIGRRPRDWAGARLNAARDLREAGRAIGGLVSAFSRTHQAFP